MRFLCYDIRMEEFESKIPKIEVPKVRYYFFDVKDDNGEPFYSVAMAVCPWCGEENQDIGDPGHIFTCGCGKQFEVGELDDTKRLG